MLHSDTVFGRPTLLAILFSLLIVTVPTLQAQDGFVRSSDKVALEHRLSLDRVPAGDTFEAAVVLDIQESWHVQSAEPTLDFLIATELSFDPPLGIEVSDLRFPPAKEYPVDFAEQPIALYSGRVPIRFTVSVAPDIEPGPHALIGKLVIQACDDEVCLAPETVEIVIPFEVVEADTLVTAMDADWFAEVDEAAQVVDSPDSEIERLFGERGTWAALVAIFLIGLALNLTPCVYPMMSVTVSVFGGQQESNVVRVFFKAVVYVLGIATMYSVLGTMAALTGGLFGGIMQNPWVLGGIALLLAALALSMFGVYEIRLPSSMMSRLGGPSTVGWTGVYLSGLVVGIFAAPCIGPPIVALLALVGAKGDPWFGFGSFFVLSLGLGSPYLVLGTFSGLLQRLPKSGAWMVWVKKVFGVVLLGVALFYGALAFAPALLWWTPIFTLLAGGVYLGFLERSGNERPVFRRIKWAVGVAAIAGGTWLFADSQQLTPMEWDTYDEAYIGAGQPVIIDFYADWCIPCHELERRTFTDPDVQRALRDHIKLKVDLTRMDTPENEEIMRAYDVRGVPTVVFLDAEGRERPNTRVTGFLPPEPFLERADL